MGRAGCGTECRRRRKKKREKRKKRKKKEEEETKYIRNSKVLA